MWRCGGSNVNVLLAHVLPPPSLRYYAWALLRISGTALQPCDEVHIPDSAQAQAQSERTGGSGDGSGGGSSGGRASDVYRPGWRRSPRRAEGRRGTADIPWRWWRVVSLLRIVRVSCLTKIARVSDVTLKVQGALVIAL